MSDDFAYRLERAMRQVAHEVGLASADPQLAVMSSEEGSVTINGSIDALAQFARGLQADLAAVTAGLTLEWSNGVTEGQIHRLKLVKRQGYGRASFPLLRQRLLQTA